MLRTPLPLPARPAIRVVVCAGLAVMPAASPDAAPLQRLTRLEAPPPHRPTHPVAIRDHTGDREADSCLAMIADDPDGAADYAADWSRRGGADRAAQCAALAEVAQGDPAVGARSLDALSQTAALPAARRASLATDAAHAWLLANQPDRALGSSSLAATLDPGNIDAVVEHGRSALAAHRPALAIADLTPVLAAHPSRADALIVRASALRQTGDLRLARQDIDAACLLVPNEPEALLERGVLRERTGDLDGARDDWNAVLSASPDTHLGDLAEQDLALLDAGPEAR